MIRKYVEILYKYISKRPILLPAVLALCFMLLVAHLGLVIAGVITCLLIMFLPQKILSGVLIIFLTFNCIHLGFGVPRPEVPLRDLYEYRVITCTDKLNGSSEVVLYSNETKRVLLKTSTEMRPKVGSVINIASAPFAPKPATNPGEFDYAKYLSNKAIYGIYYDTEYEYVSEARLDFDINVIKKYIVSRFTNNGDLAASVFLGDTSLIDDSTRQIFKDSNCSHLLAVSGTHFAGFMVVVTFLFNLIKGRRTRNIIYVVFCLLICVVTGFSPSVTRAALVCVCVYFARDKISGIALGTVITALADPISLVSMSFLMSYSICLSIILFARRIEELLRRKTSHKLANTISVIAASQIGLIPFWVTLNPRFGLMLLVVQFIASTLAGVACTLFVPCLLLGFTAPCEVVLKLIEKTTQVGSKLPYLIKLGRFTFLICIVVLSGVFAFILNRSLARQIMRRVFVIFLVFTIIVQLINVIRSPQARIVFIDVDQGDAILIMDSQNILIDGGTYEHGETISSVMDYYGISNLDVAIVTHWDEDHCGGIRYLREQGRVTNIYASYEGEYDTNEIKSGDMFNLGNSQLVCLSPSTTTYDDDNDKSVVLEYKTTSCKVLLTGDIPSTIESTLNLEDVNILKVAHHGSKYSTSDEFLSLTTPEDAVIQVGKHNNYGHPAPEVVNRLENNNIKIHDTRTSGAVIVNIYKNYYEVEGYL